MLDKLFQNLKSMLADGHDASAVSSKRVVTFFAFVLCAFGFLVDLFSNFIITQTLYDSMMWIVIAGLGFTASEKFAKSKDGEE
jgi:hypothetical protein